METLVIFAIFIIFSVIRSLGGQGQRPPGRPMPPVMTPGRAPARPIVRPPQQVSKQREETPPRYVEQAYVPYDNPIYRSKNELPDELRPAKKERIPKKAEAILPAGLICAEAGQVKTLIWNQNSVVAGVIFAEILGPPRAKNPWRPRH